MSETREAFQARVNKYNKEHGLIDEPIRELQSWEYGIKKSTYKDYQHAYIKALFYNNQKWIKYLERYKIKESDKVKITKLVSSNTYKARQVYFETGKGRLNPLLKRFIDKYNRFETNHELYFEGKGVRGIKK